MSSNRSPNFVGSARSLPWAMLLTVLAALIWVQPARAAPAMTDVCADGFGINITTNTTWRATGNPWIINCDVIVNQNVTLTIEPGTSVRFNSGRTLSVHGTLNAVGSESERINFTSNARSPAPGDWGGIRLSDLSVGSILSYVDVDYAGTYWNGAGFEVGFDGPTTVTISHSRFRFGGEDGIRWHNGSGGSLSESTIIQNRGDGLEILAGNNPAAPSNPTITSITLTDNDGAAISQEAGARPTLAGTNTATGNKIDGIQIQGAVTADTTWYNTGLPYIVDQGNVTINDGPTLTVQPGTSVRFNRGFGMTVHGTLLAIGTATTPITFTSNAPTPSPGDWAGITLNDNSTGSTIRYATLEYAGTYWYSPGALTVGPDGPTEATIQNSTIRYSSNDGIWWGAGSKGTISANTINANRGDGLDLGGAAGSGQATDTTPTVSNNTFSNNDGAAIFQNAAARPVYSGNSATGSGLLRTHKGVVVASSQIDGIAIGGTIAANTIWYNDLPYFIVTSVDVSSGQTLSVTAGSQIYAGVGVSLNVYGRLLGDGTAAQPVRFTSAALSPAAGDWGGIQLYNTSSGSQLDYVTVEYGGYYWWSGSANILVGVNGPSSLTCNNCVVRASSGEGIWWSADSTGSITASTIADNRQAGLTLDAESQVTIDGNTFTNNSGPAIKQNANAQVTYTGNTVSNNQYDGISIQGDLNSTVSWSANMPYFVGGLNISSGATLQLTPGTEVRFAPNGALYVYGTLYAVGTTTERITFTSDGAVKLAGDWAGIFFYNTSSANTISYADLLYCGRNNGNNACLSLGWGGVSDLTADNLRVQFSSSNGVWVTNGAVATLSNSLFADNRGAGVAILNGEATITGSSFQRNGVGVSATAGVGASSITGNSFDNNRLYGVQYDPQGLSTCLNATGNNWGGGGSGPLDASSASDNCGQGAHNGSGDHVSDHVNYSNYTGIQARTRAQVPPALEPDIRGPQSAPQTDVCGAYDTVTWNLGGSPYVVTCNVTVNQARTLTIEAGVELRFEPGTALIVNGNLTVNGTAASPVRLTSNAAVPGRGDWDGIHFYDASNASHITHAIVEYAGSYNYAALNIGINGPSNLQLSNSIVRYNAANGINWYSDSAIPTSAIQGNTISANWGHGLWINTTASASSLTVSDNSFVSNTQAGIYQLTAAQPIYINNSATNNRQDGILLATGNIDAQTTWYADLPYYTEGQININEAKTLTLSPGTEVRFGFGHNLVVYGTLKADGTPTDRILLTSSQRVQGAGDWGGILFHSTSGQAIGGNTLDYVDIEYGGSAQYSYPTLWVGYDGPVTNLAITNSSIRYSGGEGIRWSAYGSGGTLSTSTISHNRSHGVALHAGTAPTLSNNTFGQNGGAAIAQAADARPTLSGNSITALARSRPLALMGSNGIDGIMIWGGTMSEHTTWSNNLPYQVSAEVTVGSNKTLTVQPGATIAFNQNVGMVVLGTLLANGTAAEPIRFTSSAGTPGLGDWAGIDLADVSSGSTFTHVFLEYAGSYGYPALEVGTSGPGTTSATIRDSTIRYSAGEGAMWYNGSGGLLSDSTISGNRKDGIRIMGASVFSITNNMFSANLGAAIVQIADARLDYSGNSATANGTDTIVVNGGSISAPTTWYANLPYQLYSNLFIASGQTLTLRPGTIVKMGQAVFLDVAGQLVAQTPAMAKAAGLKVEASERITITSAERLPGPGDWGGIILYDSSTGTVLDEVDVLYAGGWGFGFYQGAIIVGQNASTSFNMRNTSIQYSAGHGIEFRNGSSGAVISSTVTLNRGNGLHFSGTSNVVTVQDNILNANGDRAYSYQAGCAVYQNAAATITYSGNQASSNFYNGICIEGSIPTDRIWYNNLNYVVLSQVTILSGATLTIQPNNQIRFANNGGLDIQGRLLANGAPGQRISFTSQALIPGGADWYGLYFRGAAANEMRHVDISYGGTGGAAVSLGDTGIATNLTLEDATVRASNSDGIRVLNGSTLVANHVTIDRNAQIGLSVQGNPFQVPALASVVQFSNGRLINNRIGLHAYSAVGNSFVVSSTIQDNTEQGFVFDSPDTQCFNAQGNFWGSSAGPLDASASADNCGLGANTTSGSPVSDNVDYGNWNQGTLAPAPPVILTPGCGYTNQSIIEVRGRTNPGTLVQLYDNGSTLGEPITPTLDGQWAITLTLTIGTHQLYATAANSYGTSPESLSVFVAFDPTLRVDPGRLTLSYLWNGMPYTQHLRDSNGCNTSCRTGGFGNVTIVPGSPVSITLHVEGNPDEVRVLVNNTPHSLTSIGDGWWQGFFIAERGALSLSIRDGFIITNECTGRIIYDPYGFVRNSVTGEPIQNATVTCQFLDTSTSTWAYWPAAEFEGQLNPQLTGETGWYSFFTPPGTYRVRVTAPGYAPSVSTELVVTDLPVEYNFDLIPATCPLDLSGDNQVTTLDLQELADHWLDQSGIHPEYDVLYDIAPLGAPDGIIDIRDIQALAAAWMSCQ